MTKRRTILTQVIVGTIVMTGIAAIGDITPRGNAHSFDSDNKADLAVYYPDNGYWVVLGSTNGPLMQQGGSARMVPVPQDYNGDGIADLAVFDTRYGTWHFKVKGAWDRVQWGGSLDVPVPGDYDADGQVDVAVYRPSTGMWYAKSSRYDSLLQMRWGWKRTIPVPADYDGDGQTDLAVFDKDSGFWHIVQSSLWSSDASINDYWRKEWWGNPLTIADGVAVPADYDNDGKADIAIYNRATGYWHIKNSDGDSVRTEKFGWPDPTLMPIPDDYDGDGIVDLAVFSPSDSIWHIRRSSMIGAEADTAINWGWQGVVPASFVYSIELMHNYFKNR